MSFYSVPLVSILAPDLGGGRAVTCGSQSTKIDFTIVQLEGHSSASLKFVGIMPSIRKQ